MNNKNKNEFTLIEAIGNIDDELILKAGKKARVRPRTIIRTAALLAALVAVICTVLLVGAEIRSGIIASQPFPKGSDIPTIKAETAADIATIPTRVEEKDPPKKESVKTYQKVKEVGTGSVCFAAPQQTVEEYLTGITSAKTCVRVKFGECTDAQLTDPEVGIYDDSGIKVLRQERLCQILDCYYGDVTGEDITIVENHCVRVAEGSAPESEQTVSDSIASTFQEKAELCVDPKSAYFDIKPGDEAILFLYDYNGDNMIVHYGAFVKNDEGIFKKVGLFNYMGLTTIDPKTLREEIERIEK